MFKTYRIVLLFFAVFFTKLAFAGDVSGTVLKDMIDDVREKGIAFKKVDLFNKAIDTYHNDLLQSATLLDVIASQRNSLYDTKPQAITLSLPASDGSIYTLDMLAFDPLASDAKFNYLDASGAHPAACDRGVHYQGIVESAGQRSLACLSVFRNGELMLLFATDKGNFVVGKLQDGSGKYILYNDRDMIDKPSGNCGVDDRYDKSSGWGQNKTTSPFGCNKVQIYWEGDYQLFQNKGSLTNAQNYLIGLFAQMQTLFRNEKIAVELKTLNIWTADDGYPDANESLALTTFTGTWNNKGDTFDGDIAQLVAMDTTPKAGVGYVDVLCNRPFAYAYSNIYGSYSTLPAYSWDVVVVAHETGHNLGSHHTHWCGWNAGPGGSCGSIDNCATQEATTACPTCATLFDNAAAANSWSGTIMSYCNFVARGIDLANGFGPLPGNKIRSSVASASCLKSIISATLTAKPICRYDGSVTITYNSNNFGVAPYQYLWSNQATSQNITGLGQPKTYSVYITDSNGCVASYYTNVGVDPAPGCFPAAISGISNVAGDLHIYPNPASQSATIQFYAHSAGIAKIKVANMLGKLIETRTVPYSNANNTVQIDVHNWPKAIYTLSFDDGAGTLQNVKLVVQ